MKESTRRRLELFGFLTPREDRWRRPTRRELWTLMLLIGVLSLVISLLRVKLGYLTATLLSIPLAVGGAMVIAAFNRRFRRDTPAEGSGKDSTWFFQRVDFRAFGGLIVLPMIGILGTPVLFEGWAARVTSGAAMLVLAGVLLRAANMGVEISGDSVWVRSFSTKTKLRADEIERFEPPERGPTDERPARVVLKDGTTIPIRALQPRRGTRFTGERSIREQVAKMNRLLGKPEG